MIFQTALLSKQYFMQMARTLVCLIKMHMSWDLVNSELANVDKWMRLNKLSINYSKSVYMLTRSVKYLCSPTELTSFNVHINNVLLQGTTCMKYLGVLIDSRLDWSSHVQLIKRKRLYACNMFFKFVNFFRLTFWDYHTSVSFIVTYNITLFPGVQPITPFYNNCQCYKTTYYG